MPLRVGLYVYTPRGGAFSALATAGYKLLSLTRTPALCLEFIRRNSSMENPQLNLKTSEGFEQTKFFLKPLILVVVFQ
jgi:hypothetical protein